MAELRGASGTDGLRPGARAANAVRNEGTDCAADEDAEGGAHHAVEGNNAGDAEDCARGTVDDEAGREPLVILASLRDAHGR